MEQLVILLPLLLICGAVAGLLAGLLGVGGGIVIVPMLYHVFTFVGVDAAVVMPLAIGTSLATIIVSSMMSARGHHARGNVDLELVRRWFSGVVLGVLLGTWLGSALPGDALRMVFGGFMSLVAIHMFVTSWRKLAVSDHLPGAWWQRVMAGGVGTVAAMLGIGGGTLVVPLLNFFSYPMHRAVGSAAVVGMIVSVPAALGYIATGWGVAQLPLGSTGYVNWLAFAALVPMTMLFAPQGVRLCQRLDVQRLRQVFAVVLLLVGLKMLLV
ncbi:MAG: sulfite exporter TauE/SafE family protein [Pseudomonadota bacterium]